MTTVLVANPVACSPALPCRDADPDLFFTDVPATIEYAKGVCAPCPVRSQCLATALERAEPHGVWGGELIESGVIVATKRPRGRPRKVPLPVVASAPEHLLRPPMRSRRRLLVSAVSSAA